MMTIALLLASLAAQTASPEGGSLQPAAASYSVGASGGTLTIQVTRTVGSEGAVGCSYTTVNGTALAGIDFTSTSGTRSWADGDSAPKSVVITILDDGVANGAKTFLFRLHSPTGGAWLGVPPTSPVVNHEGRVLGATPAVSSSLLWDTSAADAVLATLQILPANNPWNEDISGRSVAGNSDAMIDLIGRNAAIALNRDMNFAIVPGNQAKKAVTLVDYADESDPGPYPVPDNTPIEGWPIDDTRTLANVQLDNPIVGGDRHGLILDPVNGYFYEFWQTIRDGSYNWSASCEATFGLRSNTLRPDGWTSSDAAGLPILPSIPRYDECERGMVEHALRFTVSVSRRAYVYPATHYASTNTGVDRPRMGERFRLKNNTRVNGLIAAMSKHPKAIALGLQKYGMFMADNGGNWRISAGSDSRLQNLGELTDFVGGDFAVIVPTGPDEGPRAASEAVVTVTDSGGGGGDTTAPSIAIATPTASISFSASTTPLSIGGTASDNVGVTLVTWVTDRGQNGTAAFSAGTWSASVPLADGLNAITVTAMDAAGNTAADVLTATYTASSGGGTGGAGGGDGGGCGLLGIEALLLLVFLRRRE